MFTDTIEFPVEIFRKTAKAEYSNWQTAIIREFFQNSVDAGATEVKFYYNNNILTVQDNGCGMSLEDCRNKLLTVYGTDKGPNDIGGFGVAKQILFFAWNHWEVHSRNYKVIGSGGKYYIEEAPHIDGVIAKADLGEEWFQESHITDYLKQCSSEVNTYINDNLFTERRHTQQLLQTNEFGSLHKNTDQGSNYISVRSKGLLMFNTWVAPNLPSTMIFEIQGNPREIFNSNRESFKYPHANDFHKLCQYISVNTASAQTSKAAIVKQLYQGRGNTLTKTFPKEETVTPPKKNSTSIKFEKQETQLIAYDQDKPNMLLVFNNELNEKYNPKTWKVRTHKTMVLWQHLIRQILIDCEIECTFGIGMTLEEDTKAAFIFQDLTPYFLLNVSKWEFPSRNNSWVAFQKLKQWAIHEVTHMVHGGNHNEEFVLTLHHIEEKTWKSEDIYRNLMQTKLKNLEFIL